MPLKGAGGSVIGVIQLINKSSGVFTEEDQEIMNSFLTIAGPILEVHLARHSAWGLLLDAWLAQLHTRVVCCCPCCGSPTELATVPAAHKAGGNRHRVLWCVLPRVVTLPLTCL